MTGSGTINDPYIIYNVTDLQAVQNNLTAYYELANNIDASATSGWNGGLGFVPIGFGHPQTNPFLGQFDGKEYTIDSLFINRPTADFVGLFGSTSVAESVVLIKNIKLTNANITGRSFVGALVGNSWAGIKNCSSTGSITGNGLYGIGGLVGYLIKDSEELWSSCTVTATACDEEAGGLTGLVNQIVRKSYAIGNVTTNNTCKYVGGFAGRVSGECHDCYARGNATGGQFVGGFCGENDGAIENCYSTGVPTGTTDVGGFCGENLQTITDCFWDIQTSGQSSSDGGTGKTTAEMKTLSTFLAVGWDISASIWLLIPECNNGYPCLWNITPSCALIFPIIYPPYELTALEALRNIEMSAAGRVYVDETGKLKYESRYARNP